MNLNDKMNSILEIVKTMSYEEILVLERCVHDVQSEKLGKEQNEILPRT